MDVRRWRAEQAERARASAAAWTAIEKRQKEEMASREKGYLQEADPGARFGQSAGGYFGGRDAFIGQAKDRGRRVAGDTDGDGKVSNLERFDKDGDGFIEMHEYAMQATFKRQSNSGPPAAPFESPL